MRERLGIGPADEVIWINITFFDDVVGFRMPDAIVAADVGGETLILTANEGDSRDFDEARVFDLATDGLLDADLQQRLIDRGDLDLANEDFGLGRLEVSSIFKWYRGDFEKGWRGADNLYQFLAIYANSLGLTKGQQAELRSGKTRISFLSYDWRLNRTAPSLRSSRFGCCSQSNSVYGRGSS